MSTDGAVPADRNVIKTEAENILKYNRNSAHVESESKSDTSYTRSNWNSLKITQTVPEQPTGKARNYGSTKNIHIWHCTQTAGSADVKVQNIWHGRNNITCSTDCKYRTAATLYAVDILFVSGM